MAKRRPQVTEVSHGLYERFDAEGDALPKVEEFTTRVPAEVGREFGFILRIQHARGLTLSFEIDHPRIPDGKGGVMPPFRGEQFIDTSDFHFFLGDALWAPLDHMVGPWALSVHLAGERIAARTFDVQRPTLPAWDEVPMQ